MEEKISKKDLEVILQKMNDARSKIEKLGREKEGLLAPIKPKITKINDRIGKLEEGLKKADELLKQTLKSSFEGEKLTIAGHSITWKLKHTPSWSKDPSETIQYLKKNRLNNLIRVKEELDKDAIKKFYEEKKAINSSFTIPGFSLVSEKAPTIKQIKD